jgi:hypothetical protein
MHCCGPFLDLDDFFGKTDKIAVLNRSRSADLAHGVLGCVASAVRVGDVSVRPRAHYEAWQYLFVHNLARSMHSVEVLEVGSGRALSDSRRCSVRSSLFTVSVPKYLHTILANRMPNNQP